MKAVLLLCIFAVAVYARPEQYTDRYDNINLEEILTNDQLTVAYIKCTLDKGKCTPDGKELKSHIKEALENYCAKCTEAQRKGTRRVIGHLINNKPDYWNQLKAKYDSEGKYVHKYEADLRTIH